MASAGPALELRGIDKSFPGVQALAGVDLTVQPGQVMALIGENGAGKSTLLKILSGNQPADKGEIRIDGRQVVLPTPQAARLAGIAMVHQELQQVPELDVAQNLFLGQQPTRLKLFVDRKRMEERAREVLAVLDAPIDPRQKCKDLSVAQRQMVEIARGLLADARIVALDEPTSSLTPHEFERLADVIATLTGKGVAIVYVSHKLDEVFRLCDRATVLRDGRLVGEVALAGRSEADLVGMMVGRELETTVHRSHARSDRVLAAEGLCRGRHVQDVSFTLDRGEVLCIGGLVGAGRTELVRLIAGLDRPSAGQLHVHGRPMTFRSPRDAIRAGIGLVPEERKREGIIPLRPVVSNIVLPTLARRARAGLVSPAGLEADARALAVEVDLRPPDVRRPIRLFSGGNQQKAIVARWLGAHVDILIFDEPTRGVDVGAKQEIYRLIERLAEQGAAVIVVSSELPEILRLADRVLVMQAGRATALLARSELSEEAIMRHAIPGAA